MGTSINYGHISAFRYIWL